MYGYSTKLCWKLFKYNWQFIHRAVIYVQINIISVTKCDIFNHLQWLNLNCSSHALYTQQWNTAYLVIFERNQGLYLYLCIETISCEYIEKGIDGKSHINVMIEGHLHTILMNVSPISARKLKTIAGCDEAMQHARFSE